MTVTAQSAQAVKLIYFGLDVSKDHFDAGSREAGLAPVQRHELKSMKISRFGRSLEGARAFIKMAHETACGSGIIVVMESTGSYSLELSHWLWQADPDVAIADVPPKRVRDWCSGTGVRAKTDNIDAGLIACYGAERQPVARGPRKAIYENLKAVTRAREALVAKRQATQLQLEESLRDHVSKEISRVLKASFGRVIKAYDHSIEKLEEKIKELLASDPELRKDAKLADSLPGVGLITVATIFGEAGDLRRFRSRELVAFAGLDPVTRQSGTSVISPRRMTRRGNTRIRRILANAAWAATRTKNNNPFKAAFHRLIAKGKPTLVALNAVMKKMLCTIRAALKAGCYLPVTSGAQPVGKP